jgi:subtilisin
MGSVLAVQPMSGTPPDLSRRTVLGLAAGLAGTAAAGLAAGSPDDTVRVNVGYERPSGARAARREADRVHYEFAFEALTIETSRAGAGRLSRRGDVRYVEIDAPLRTVAQDLPWGIDRVDAEVAHANGDTGDGADVAIIDTGIDATHPDLMANLGEGKAFVGSTATGTGTPAWQDDNGHGTHCAGIADAVDNDIGVVGVSTKATLHAVKVLSASGVGLTSDVAKGIEYVGDKGWDVGSLSLGGPASGTLQDACQYAVDRGVLLVAAAGNDGPCSDCVGYPAAYSTVQAVSATSRDDSLADFSSTGPEIELAAPGDSIYSTYLGGTYATLSGTSMACPHVSGAGGQLMANGYTATEARQRLNDTAEDVGLPSNEQGNGLLDVANALGYDSSDDLGGDGSNGSDDTGAPSVSVDGVSEHQSNNPHAEFDVAWSAHDDEGNLDSVSLQLRDVTDGEFEDSASYDVSGSDASDTTRLKAHKDDGSGNEYEVTVTARDTAGNSGEDSARVTENGS